MANRHLIVFVKNFKLGAVKTRLAKTVGDANALKIYKALVAHTAEICVPIPMQVHVFYSDEIVNEDDWVLASKKFVQEGGDLGERLQNALKRIVENGDEQVCIIGSDCYGLKTEHLIEAFDILATKDAVIGPAKDGGYYLIGCSGNQALLFEDIEWSTDTVCGATKAKLQERKMTYKLLEMLSDVDDESDLGDLKMLLE